MPAEQNVQIPLSLFRKIIALHEFIDASGCHIPGVFGRGEILAELREKQLRVNIRGAYSAAVSSRDADARRGAISNYAKLKRRLGGRAGAGR